MRGQAVDGLARVGVAGLLLALWQAAVSLRWASSTSLPAPAAVWSVLVDWFATGQVWVHIWTTLEELLLGLVIGTLAGVLAAFLLAYVPVLAAALQLYLSAINGLPRAALAPLFILWLGFGIQTQVALAALLIFFHAFLTTYEGLLSIDDRLVSHVRLLGADPAQEARLVFGPASLVWVLASLRASVGLGFLGVIVGEYLGARQGLGTLLAAARSSSAIDRAFAALVLIAFVAAIVGFAVGAFSDRYQSRSLGRV